MATPAARTTFAAVPPEAAEVLRPTLPGLADEMIAAIAVEVPDYARAMEGTFGQMVRLGVEVALGRFMDMIADPTADVGSARDTYVKLGRGEFHAGRSLDALLAAYRVGARLAWRRFVEAGKDAGSRSREGPGSPPPTRCSRSARRCSPTSTRSPRSPPTATPRSSRRPPERASAAGGG